jgi:hypothetical protein
MDRASADLRSAERAFATSGAAEKDAVAEKAAAARAAAHASMAFEAATQFFEQATLADKNAQAAVDAAERSLGITHDFGI